MWSSAKTIEAATLFFVVVCFWWFKFLSKSAQFCREFNPHFVFFRNHSQKLRLEIKSETSQRNVTFGCRLCYKSTGQSEISPKYPIYPNISQKMKILPGSPPFLTFQCLHVAILSQVSWTVLCWTHLCCSFIGTMKSPNGTVCFCGSW